MQVPEVQARGTDFEELIEKFKSAVIEYLSDNPFMDTFLRGRVVSANSPMPYKGKILQEKIHPLEIEDPRATDKFPTPFLQEQERKITRQQKNPGEESEIVFLERILKSADRWWLDVVRKACPVAHFVNQRTLELDFYNRLYLLYSDLILRYGDSDKVQDDRRKTKKELTFLNFFHENAEELLRAAQSLRPGPPFDLTERDIQGFAKTVHALTYKLIDATKEYADIRSLYDRGENYRADRNILRNTLIRALHDEFKKLSQSEIRRMINTLLDQHYEKENIVGNALRATNKYKKISIELQNEFWKNLTIKDKKPRSK